MRGSERIWPEVVLFHYCVVESTNDLTLVPAVASVFSRSVYVSSVRSIIEYFDDMNAFM